jgi:hypothetical protein
MVQMRLNWLMITPMVCGFHFFEAAVVLPWDLG